MQYQLAGALVWETAPSVDVSLNLTYISPVVVGGVYNVRIRSMRSSGVGSDWAFVDNYTVATVSSYLGTLGGEVTAITPIAYAGLSANLIPNGNFILGNINGWSGAGHYSSGGIAIPALGGATSPAFNVTPGNKYRFAFTGQTTGTGTQSVYHRIQYGASYSANMPQVAGAYTDFLAAGAITSTLTSYTYDWVCPAGVFYASLAIYENGATAPLLYTNVSAQDYVASGQWGADVTGSNQSASTATLSNHTSDDLPSGSQTLIPGNYHVAIGVSGPVWVNLGRWTFGTIPRNLKMEYQSGQGYNSSGHQQVLTDVFMRSSNNTSAPNLSGLSWLTYGNSAAINSVKAVAAGGSTSASNNVWDIYANISAYSDGTLIVYPSPGDTFVFNGSFTTDPGAARSTVVVGTGQQVTDGSGNVTNVGGQPSSGITPIIGLMPVEVGADKTLNHVITAVDSGLILTSSGGSVSAGYQYTVASFNVIANDPSDVFNIQASLQWLPNGTNFLNPSTVWSFMTGWVDAPALVGTSPIYGGSYSAYPTPTVDSYGAAIAHYNGWANSGWVGGVYKAFGFGSTNLTSTPIMVNSTVNFFGSITGLSAGSHNISLTFNPWVTYSSAPIPVYVYALLTQVSS